MRTLYSGHFSIEDIVFRFQLTLPPRTDTSKIRHFLARNLYTFYFGQCFTVSCRFSSIFVILLFWPLQVHKNVGIVNLMGLPVCIHLYGWRVFQLQRCSKRNGAGIEKWIQSWRFLLYMDNHFSFTMRLVRTKETAFLSTSLIGSFTRYKHSPTSCLQIII